MLDLIDKVKRMLDGEQTPPTGYNIGFDAGEAAGQSVMHLHVHVIPRRGMEAPGGMRQVVPSANEVVLPPTATVPDAPPSPVHTPVEPPLLPAAALERARGLIAAFCERSGGDGMLKQPGGLRARVLGPSYDGGVRIVGPDTGFVEHIISELELAWVIANEQHGKHDGSLDTAWAIALFRAAQE
ncbi:MAG: HIT family protein [Polyangiales bacterium]